MTDGKVTYSAQGIEIEEDDKDRSYLEHLSGLNEEELLEEFRFFTRYDRRLMQIVTEINSRKENKN